PPTAPAPTPLASVLQKPRPYSAWREFFVPSLRVPSITQVTDTASHLGLTLGGSDLLGMHSWLLSGTWQPRQAGDSGGPYFGGAARYRNTMLAPWTVLVEASAFHGSEKLTPEDPQAAPVFRDHKTRDLALLTGRTWYGTWSAVGGVIYSETRDREAPGLAPAEHLRLGGPTLAVSYFGGDSTPYTGLRRALIVSLAASHFPEIWSSLSRSATSLRAGLSLVTPAPLTRRQILALSVVGHAIVRPADIIELGGASAFTPLSTRSNQPEPTNPSVATPPNLRLVEPLRGYEDASFAVSRFVGGELSWTYALIIDRGIAATAWILPASFLRQLDLDLFAAGALSTSLDTMTSQPAQHLALGGGVTVRVRLLNLPLAIRYQLARRLRDDHALTQMIALGADL
ncbi:MAG TPA: hypothetical protein PKU97_08225, partial [Kofleriaceae bacterium]|nr:hypothetical protein [Kofleriaceae bacterium]